MKSYLEDCDTPTPNSPPTNLKYISRIEFSTRYLVENAIRTGLGEYTQRFTEHPVPVFVLAKHHELVLPPRIQIVYRRLGDFSRQDLHRSPLGRVGWPVPVSYTYLITGGVVILRSTIYHQRTKGNIYMFIDITRPSIPSWVSRIPAPRST